MSFYLFPIRIQSSILILLFYATQAQETGNKDINYNVMPYGKMSSTDLMALATVAPL